LWRGTLLRAAGLALALALPLALGATAALRYMPHGLVLPLTFAAVVHAFTASGVAATAAHAPAGWRRRLLVAGTAVLVVLVAVTLVLLPYRPIVVAGEAAPRGPFTLPRPV